MIGIALVASFMFLHPDYNHTHCSPPSHMSERHPLGICDRHASALTIVLFGFTAVNWGEDEPS